MSTMSHQFNPHRFEVSFGRDPQTGRILALLYAEEPEFRTVWDALPDVESYGYWNNSDQPDDVTDDEWAERREVWERVMPDSGPPVESMLSFALRGEHDDIGMMRLVNERSAPEVNALLRSVAPSDDARANRIVSNAITGAWRAHRYPEPNDAAPQPQSSDWFALFRRIRRSDTSAITAVVAAELADRNSLIDYVFAGAPDEQQVVSPMNREVITTAAAAWVEADMVGTED